MFSSTQAGVFLNKRHPCFHPGRGVQTKDTLASTIRHVLSQPFFLSILLLSISSSLYPLLLHFEAFCGAFLKYPQTRD